MLIYLGVLDDKKTAVFLLDSGVIAQGDGTCKPSRTSCETIQIREGETEFFDVAGDDGDRSEPARRAVPARRAQDPQDHDDGRQEGQEGPRRVSPKGRMILRARIAGDGPLRYRYDAKTGGCRSCPSKAYKAVVAKAARAARAHF